MRLRLGLLSPAQRQLAPAVLAFAAAAELFAYAGLGASDHMAAGQALALVGQLAADDAALSARLQGEAGTARA